MQDQPTHAGSTNTSQCNNWLNNSILLHAVIKETGSVDIIHSQRVWKSFDKK